jgi:hypothetical protein
MSESIATGTTLDLAFSRVIVLAGPRKTYKLTCRRVTPEDWTAYYASLSSMSERDGRSLVTSVDIETPRRKLAERVIVNAEGYTIVGGGDLVSVANWQTKLPLSHRMKVAEVLASIFIDTAESDVIHLDGIPVTLATIWTAAADGTGMEKVSGLKHILKEPTEKQHQRYARESSRTQVLGGSRAGTTVYPGCQKLLAALYDELVISVDGYSSNGAALSDVATIRREMDMHHKVVAAQEIFRPMLQAQLAEPMATGDVEE